MLHHLVAELYRRLYPSLMSAKRATSALTRVDNECATRELRQLVAMSSATSLDVLNFFTFLYGSGPLELDGETLIEIVSDHLVSQGVSVDLPELFLRKGADALRLALCAIIAIDATCKGVRKIGVSCDEMDSVICAVVFDESDEPSGLRALLYPSSRTITKETFTVHYLHFLLRLTNHAIDAHYSGQKMMVELKKID